jgi:hypothetical protein
MHSTTAQWLRGTASITRIKLDPSQYWKNSPPGERYTVDATFWYVGRPPVDPSFPSGEHYWGYSLIRLHHRFLISDEGVG